MIFIKPHRPRQRSRDYILGLHIHDQRSAEPESPQNDLLPLDPNDAGDPLQPQHYPRGRLYTPEVDRWRECLRRYKEQHPLEEVKPVRTSAPAASASNAQNIEPVDKPEGDGGPAVPPVSDDKKRPEKASVATKLRKLQCCISKQYPVDLDLEHEGTMFLKVMILRSFQMLTAFGFTFYVQVTWEGENAAVTKPTLVQFAFDFSWLLYLGIATYAILYVIVRFWNVAKHRSLALLIYMLKGTSIVLAIYIAGVRWELVTAPTIALTLICHCLFLGFLPQFKEDIYVSKRRKLLLMVTFFDVLLFSFGCWFMVSNMLINYSSFVSLSVSHEDIYSQLFLHCGSTAVVAGCTAILDLLEILKMLKGRRFPIPNRKTWVRVAASL